MNARSASLSRTTVALNSTFSGCPVQPRKTHGSMAVALPESTLIFGRVPAKNPSSRSVSAREKAT
jgi:hypothetical protein